MKIPKIIHQTWKDVFIPHWLAKYVATWIHLNPDWEYIFWSDNDLDLLIAEEFPFLVSSYSSLPLKIMKVDLARYCIMSKYGGVYADIDFECYRPLGNILAKHQLTFSWEWPGAVKPGLIGKGRDLSIDLIEDHFLSTPTYDHTLGNSILASSQNHIFWNLIIQDLSSTTFDNKINNEQVVGLTGPQFLTEKFICYYDPKWDVQIFDNSVFYPISWHKPVKDDGYRAWDFKTSYGAHHWNGSWWQEPPDATNEAVKVNDIIDNPLEFCFDILSQF